MSDLANSRGNLIPDSRRNGLHKSHLNWPAITCPLKQVWATFREFLRRSFATNTRAGRLNQPLLLGQPLGH